MGDLAQTTLPAMLSKGKRKPAADVNRCIGCNRPSEFAVCPDCRREQRRRGKK